MGRIEVDAFQGQFAHGRIKIVAVVSRERYAKSFTGRSISVIPLVRGCCLKLLIKIDSTEIHFLQSEESMRGTNV